ncbi:hypothetical protein D3C76_1556120 [compost metagenome]
MVIELVLSMEERTTDVDVTLGETSWVTAHVIRQLIFYTLLDTLKGIIQLRAPVGMGQLTIMTV